MSYYLCNFENLVLTTYNGYAISAIDHKSKTIYIGLESSYDIDYRNSGIVREAIKIANENPLKYKVVLGLGYYKPLENLDQFLNANRLSRPDIKRIWDIKDNLKNEKNISVGFTDDDLHIAENNYLRRELNNRRELNLYNSIVDKGKFPDVLPYELNNHSIFILLRNMDNIEVNENNIKTLLKILTLPSRTYGYYLDKVNILCNTVRHFNDSRVLNAINNLAEKSFKGAYDGESLLKEYKETVKEFTTFSKLFDA